VIRKIYGWHPSHLGIYPWQFWLKVARAADKYLEPDLMAAACSNIAHKGFRRAGSYGLHCDEERCDVEGVCEMLDVIREFDSNEDVIKSAARLAGLLQKRHVRDSERFRSYL
jgi:hypothetical protein